MSVQLPVIAENCPACFDIPKERHRIKQLLATQVILQPFLTFKIGTPTPGSISPFDVHDETADHRRF